jgi:hypothetical protein
MASPETALTPYNMNDAGDPLAQSPEVQLWRAQIWCALDDMRHGDRRRACALKWIKSNARHVGSFVWTCHAIGLSCSAARRALLVQCDS